MTPKFIYLHICTSARLQKSDYLGSLMLLFMYFFYPQLHFVQLGGSWSVMPVQCYNLGLLRFLGDSKSNLMMKSWQTPLNKTPSKRGKEGTKRTKSKSEQQNPKWVTKGQRNKSCSKSPANHKKHPRKRRVRNLKEE